MQDSRWDGLSQIPVPSTPRSYQDVKTQPVTTLLPCKQDDHLVRVSLAVVIQVGSGDVAPLVNGDVVVQP